MSAKILIRDDKEREWEMDGVYGGWNCAEIKCSVIFESSAGTWSWFNQFDDEFGGYKTFWDALNAAYSDELDDGEVTYGEYAKVPVCPNCGENDYDWWMQVEMNLTDGDTYDLQCQNCGKPYRLKYKEMRTYSTAKLLSF